MKTTRELTLERYSAHLGRSPEMTPHIMRSLERCFADWLPADRNAPILDAGCGEGNLLAFLRAKGYANLSGFDLSPECVRLCRERGLEFVQTHDAEDAARFAGPKDGWAVIFCLDLLEHIPRERAAGFLTGLRSRLAKGGCLIVQTVNMSYLGANSVLYGDLTHEAGYTEASLASLLSVAGFARVEIRPHWYATTWRGGAREVYLRRLHRAVYWVEGRNAPRIASKNLLARAHAAVQA